MTQIVNSNIKDYVTKLIFVYGGYMCCSGCLVEYANRMMIILTMNNKNIHFVNRDQE